MQNSILLSEFSNYKIGGVAKYFLEVNSENDLINGLKQWDNKGKIFILGGGTNILFSDEGFNGLVIKNSIRGKQLQDTYLSVGSGEKFSDILDYCIENSLSGLEWAGGLPGTVGGAVRGNAGAFGGETKDSVVEIESINLNNFQKMLRNNVNCNFSYRNSIFKSGEGKEEIITKVKFKLDKKNQEEIKSVINKNIEYRKQKHPLEFPNIGSIFKNVPLQKFSEKQKQEFKEFIKNDPFPVIPVAKLIFIAGLKGKSVGNVMISEKHTNFIVNLGGGKASEVKELIKTIRNAIQEKFNVSLEEEIIEI